MENALTVYDLNTTVNHEPRFSHRRIAEALGFVQRHKIAHLIERHLEALQRFGEVPSTVDGSGPKGGRPGKTYWLNKRQCLYICTKSETPKATEATILMVEVFDAYLQGKLTEKPVKVRAHRRAIPAPQPDPVPSGSDILRDLYKAVVAANVRVERGFAPDFGVALEGVLLDMEAAASGCEPGLMRALMGGSRVVRDRMKFGAPLAS